MKRLLPVLAAATLVASCAVEPPRRPVRSAPVAAAPAPPPPSPEVFAYPAQGQSDQQLDRDRYECHLWAVRESGFDPSRPGLPPQQRVRVVREPGPGPAATTAAGAVTGAVLGAAVSRPWEAGTGAAIGAVAGGVLGAAVGAEQEQRAREASEARQAAAQARSDGYTKRVDDYRRAISACLTGRGYTVK
jgi:hypothetical protein